jgi:hypothetical protein
VDSGGSGCTAFRLIVIAQACTFSEQEKKKRQKGLEFGRELELYSYLTTVKNYRHLEFYLAGVGSRHHGDNHMLVASPTDICRGIALHYVHKLVTKLVLVSSNHQGVRRDNLSRLCFLSPS